MDPLFASEEEAARWAAELAAGTPGRSRFDYCGTATSTQDLAFEAGADGAPDLSLFLAEEQQAGRGRQGAAWLAHGGSSLLFSVLLSPAPKAVEAGKSSLAAAAAICRAAERVCGLKAGVKWPNDVLCGERKVGGVLVEVRDHVAVVGVGLNILQSAEEFDGELAGRATSLSAECGQVVERREVLSILLAELGTVIVETNSAWDRLRVEVDDRLLWRGRQVRIGSRQGILVGVDSAGHLVLRDHEGNEHCVAAGSPELVDS